MLTLIRETVTTEGILRKKCAALHLFVNVSVLWIFFSESALGDSPKKWHLFLFRVAYAAYLPSY